MASEQRKTLIAALENLRELARHLLYHFESGERSRNDRERFHSDLLQPSP